MALALRIPASGWRCVLAIVLILALSGQRDHQAVSAASSGSSAAASAATKRYREGCKLLQQCCGGGAWAGVGRNHRRGPESEKQLAEAQAAAAAAVQLDQSRWQHRNLLGEVYLQQENWQGAAQEFLATTQLDNQVASAFLKLGYALSKLPGYGDKALESRLIAARLNTDFADLDDDWNSLVPSRIQSIESPGRGEGVMVQAPPLGPPLAILIPYRDRAEHLEVLVPALSKILDRQHEREQRRRHRRGDKSSSSHPGQDKHDDGANTAQPVPGIGLRAGYRIFVIEQANDKRWNKGIVYNAGFHHIRTSRRYGAPECFVFHDVDFIPQNDDIHYGCVKIPTHLSAAPSQYTQYRYGSSDLELQQTQQVAGVPYASFFGGVLQMSARSFVEMNGYSNRYWLWGKEDDDLYTRMLQSNTSGGAYCRATPVVHGLHRTAHPHTDAVNGVVRRYRAGLFARESVEVGQYKCLDHQRDYSNVGSNVELLIAAVVGEHKYTSEGLSTVNYSIVSEELMYVDNPGAAPSSSNHKDAQTASSAHETSDEVGRKQSKRSKSKSKANTKARNEKIEPERYPYTHIKVDF